MGTVATELPPQDEEMVHMSSVDEEAITDSDSLNTDRVLVVEDDASSRQATEALLADAGYSSAAVPDGAVALQRLAEGFSVVITDLRMPHIDGYELIRTLREHHPQLPVIVLTGHGSEEAAVLALKSGAFHYLPKPVNPDELLHYVDQACQKFRMSSEIARLHQQLEGRGGFRGMVGRSESMRRIFEQIRMVAETRSTVLIQGESGTGKELIARAVHDASPRRGQPFVAVNCAALPASLIESELFGHAKGAFTGANEQRQGKFAAAQGGTLFIDEIAEMQPELQSKFLRAIENRSITPLGSNEEITTDVRIIASTHQDLTARIATGEFRQDLYYRLNVVRIELPPLRDRREDVPLLVRAFLDELARENNRPVRDLTPEALTLLQGYDWPGNVRELRNVLESAMVMSARDVLDVTDFPDPIRQTPSAPPLQALMDRDMTMAEIEREVIRQTLARTQGNRTEASRILGLSTRTLQRRIKEYNLNI